MAAGMTSGQHTGVRSSIDAQSHATDNIHALLRKILRPASGSQASFPAGTAGADHGH